MHRTPVLLLLCAIALFSSLVAIAAPIVIDTVPVGNPGNPADPSDGDPYSSGIQHFGSVAYDYRIGTYEVTNAQYAAFLNAKAASDPLALYNSGMNSDSRGGIARSGTSGNFTYTVKPNMGNKPVNYVSWYDAIRFANWLNNGQGSANTETGAYTLGILGAGGVPTSGLNITRNSGATWFLTSEDEWYKAAYHQPASQGGDVDGYWLYPTASNSTPVLATADSVGDINNPGSNVVNAQREADWNNLNGNVTTVGSAGPLSRSFYGTSDQGGNVYEWNEARIGDSSRVFRGGSWSSDSADSESASRNLIGDPVFGSNVFGFRVATISVPEPASLVLAALGLVAIAAIGWHRSNATRQSGSMSTVS